MDRTDFAKIVMAIKTYYPSDKVLVDEVAVDLWFKQLQDLDYLDVQSAINKWVATNKFMPTIADIRSYCIQEKNADWGAGWEEVVKAIQHFGVWNVQGALDSMTPLTRKVVERLGFYDLCNSENTNSDRANFRDLYEKLSERERQNQVAIGVKDVRLIEGD